MNQFLCRLEDLCGHYRRLSDPSPSGQLRPGTEGSRRPCRSAPPAPAGKPRPRLPTSPGWRLRGLGGACRKQPGCRRRARWTAAVSPRSRAPSTVARMVFQTALALPPPAETRSRRLGAQLPEPLVAQPFDEGDALQDRPVSVDLAGRLPEDEPLGASGAAKGKRSPRPEKGVDHAASRSPGPHGDPAPQSRPGNPAASAFPPVLEAPPGSHQPPGCRWL